MKLNQFIVENKFFEKLGRLLKGWLGFTLIQLFTLIVFIWMLFSVVPWLINQPVFYRFLPKREASNVSPTDVKMLQIETIQLQKKIDRLTPGGVYLVINTTDNTFFLYKNRQLIREGVCSTGSYIKLETETDKNWLFETPKGVFTIKGKTVNPVWRKPDWAFIEEGLPVPPAGDPSRYEYGVLGDYALSLGDGYLIHGTLYKRFLGMPVTHGCVRMGDEDLELVFKTLPNGAKVFIY
ncbi:L,D-transpeptidase [Maribellus sp. YY47]|uniref:L,D-transpeptidase n=1 Tax=Maribellus sp. YY47 TaxID=2929486 RepID=UPI002000672D|nr:L,D-transpeptidase [Maribellus sp. YY47]MCK3683320.1 L,D-transpeptidase [Maribellus sp. YY47]